MTPADRARAVAGRLLAEADQRLPREESFPAAARSIGLTARVGRWLGITFAICFVTGLASHLAQNPPFGIDVWPARPSWLYRLSQGVHVTTGVASIPLLAVKLWSVAPKFWRRPLLGGLLLALERGSILVLIAACGFELLTGLANVAQFYGWTFFFPRMHFAMAFVAVGSILLHIAVKLPVIRSALGQPAVTPAPGGWSRRGVLGLAATGSGLAVLTTVGDKIGALSPVSVFSQRTGAGPQGLPVNGTAAALGVGGPATSDQWRLTVAAGPRSLELTRAELLALPQRRARLPIACVEGWSFDADWTGVRLADLLALVGARPTRVQVISLDRGLYGRSVVSAQLAADPDSLVALSLNGMPLALDHGYPCRLIAPNRPGVLQTKWLSRIEVL